MGLSVPLWAQRIGGWFLNLLYVTEEEVGWRVADISKITPQFFVGGAVTTEDDVQAIADAGITVAIDCRGEYDDEPLIDEYNDLPPTPKSLVNHPKIDYLYNGVADDGKPKPVSWFQFSWEFAEPLLKNGEAVLCHCLQGHNRGPSMCYFLMRAYLKMDAVNAHGLILSKRPAATMAYQRDADAAIEALGLSEK